VRAARFYPRPNGIQPGGLSLFTDNIHIIGLI